MTQYSQTAIDHFRYPRNAGILTDADIVGHGSLGGRAPYTQIYLQFDGDVVQCARFTTFGCGASVASASALTEMTIGKTCRECRRISAADLLQSLDGLPADKEFCVYIAISALQDALNQWEGSGISNQKG